MISDLEYVGLSLRSEIFELFYMFKKLGRSSVLI